MPLLALLKAHWRKLVVPLLLVAAFLGGRLAAPVRVEERVEFKDRVVERVVTVQAEAEIRYVDRVQRVVVTRTVTPEGAVTEHSETTTGERETAASSSTRSTEAQREAVREVTREKLVEVRPSWRFSALAGVDLWSVWAGTPRPVFGGAVEHRVGPVYGGLWGVISPDGRTAIGGVKASF